MRKGEDFSDFFHYFIQQCFIGHPSDSTVSEDWDQTHEQTSKKGWQCIGEVSVASHSSNIGKTKNT
jgi:hypothetical protein